MLTALEAMPGAALLVLMAVCAAGGALAGRGWDRLVDGFYDTCDTTRRGMWLFGHFVRRLLTVIGVVGGLLTLVAAVFLANH